MVSDGLSMINVADVEHVLQARQGAGSATTTISATTSTIRPASKAGANCLLGTKVMIPIDGPVRENVGLLGSPCFEIPRAVERDKNFNLALDESCAARAAEPRRTATTS